MSARIAIVGAGPSGCYTAQALLKIAPELTVDVIDAQPTPFGLVRYGVAADHQGTKNIARQFQRVFTHQKARFFGNVRIGADVSLEALEDAYDAVVLAAGLSGDRRLGVPGDDLDGIIGSGALTRAIYEHPDAAALPDLGDSPVIIGTGNVAIDILRLLAKSPQELNGSDLGQGPTEWLAAQRFKKITVLGRSSAGAARFGTTLLKELRDLTNVDISIVYPGVAVGPDQEGKLEVLKQLEAETSGLLPLTFQFNSRPVAIKKSDDGLMVDVDTPDGPQSVPATSVISAIGFLSDGSLGRDAMLDGSGDKVRPQGRIYTIGWFRNGSVGAIPDCRKDAMELAQRIMADLTPDPARIGSAVMTDLSQIMTFQHWEHMDAQERGAAPEGRCRQKISQRAEMLAFTKPQDA